MGKIQIVFFDVHGTILNPKTNEICGTIADEGIYKFLLNHLII